MRLCIIENFMLPLWLQIKQHNHISMTVVSSKEFITNQKKYFDLALNEQVFIKNGKNMFIVTCADDPQSHYSPEFVEKIRQAEYNLSVGKFMRVKDVKNLWDSIP